MLRPRDWAVVGITAIVVTLSGAPLIYLVWIFVAGVTTSPSPELIDEPTPQTALTPHQLAIGQMAVALFHRGIKAGGPKPGGSEEENIQAAVLGEGLRGPDRDGLEFTWSLRTSGSRPMSWLLVTAPDKRLKDGEVSSDAVVEWRLGAKPLPANAYKMGSDLITTAAMACQYQAKGKDWFDGNPPKWITRVDRTGPREGLSQTITSIDAEAGGYGFVVHVIDELDVREPGPWCSIRIEFWPLHP